jgi:hypothetical protein
MMRFCAGACRTLSRRPTGRGGSDDANDDGDEERINRMIEKALAA